jgi:hypothetical protein
MGRLKECTNKVFNELIRLKLLVSPTYGYIESALVKCSNDEGLGPRYNREEDPGSSIFSMLMVYGCYLHLLTFSEKQVTGRINGDLSDSHPAFFLLIATTSNKNF